jgi:hypothetical protein
MARSYSSPSYAGHHTITVAGNVGLHTAAGLSQAIGVRIMYPCKVMSCNLTFPGGLAGDLGTSTSVTINRSTDSGTGLIAFGTCDFYSELATCTFAAGEIIDYTVTETTFNAGDDLLIAIEGTVGEVFTDVLFSFEAVEVFQEADS